MTDDKSKMLQRTMDDLRSEVGLVRRYAVRELARHGDERVLNALMDVAARDVEMQIRTEAGQAVSEIKARTGVKTKNSPGGPVATGWSESGDGDDEDVPGPGRAPAVSFTPAFGMQTEIVPPPTPGATIELAETRENMPPSATLPPGADAGSTAAPPTSTPRTLTENVARLNQIKQRSAEEAQRLRRALLDQAIAGTGVKVQEKKYGFKLEVGLLNGRRQFVRVGFEQSDFESDKIIVVFSPCGPAKPKHYRWALELNHRLTYGRVGLHHAKEGDIFVMTATLLEATADPAELRKAIFAVAEKGDRIEAMFGPEDRY